MGMDCQFLIMCLIVTIPVLVFIRRDPSVMGLLPDGQLPVEPLDRERVAIIMPHKEIQ